MNNDCIGCPYYIKVGKGDRICTAPNECEWDSAERENVNYESTGIPSDLIESLISGLLDD